MAASISQQLEDLLNPLPNFVDPEDDEDEETKAKVVEKFDEESVDDEESASGHLRKRAVSILADSDRRYRGKATTRRQLQKELDGSDDEELEDDDDDDDEENGIVDKYMKSVKDAEEDDENDEDDIDDDENDENEDCEEDEDQDGNDDEEDLLANESSEVSSLVSKLKDTDFMKLAEGMDDLGNSEDEEDSAKGDEEEGESEEEESALRTFSKEKVDEEVEKGKAVKNQLALWDLMLEGRIKMQKALVTANQLPQSQTFPDFKTRGGPEYAEALKNSHKALKALQRSLLELQDQLLYQNPETRGISQGKTWSANSKDKDDEEINSKDDEENMNDDEEEEQKTGRNGPPKRKLEMAEYPSYMAKRFAAFQPYRDATLQKWYDKTRLTMGKTNKGFGAFERNILTQVEQVLMDKERLVRRTQTRRSQYRVLGKPEPITPEIDNTITTEEEAAELALKANAHLKDLDEEIFDDDDFYHQLLRELIERKTSAADPNDQVAMGRQWLAIQKLRSKIKKKVDTKASKGRKIRFHVHSKLVNFMAPFDNSSMSDDARSELYRSLFANAPVTAH